MTQQGPYPPPGQAPGPPYPQPVPQQPYAGWTQPQVHRPGAIPLRPLSLGDLYDGAFRIIRHNPGATVGSAVLVSAVAMLAPLLLTFVAAATLDLGSWFGGGTTEDEVLEDLGLVFASGVGTLLQAIGLIFVTGMVAHVATAAASGRRLTLAEAWALTRGRRWRLVGLSLVLGLLVLLLMAVYVVAWVAVVVVGGATAAILWGLVTVPLFLAALSWTWIRLYLLAVPPLMVEGHGVFDAIGRGYALTHRHFWRTFGIALLTVLVTGFASGVLGVPAAIAGEVARYAVGGSTGIFLLLLAQAVGTILASAFVTPFTAAVVTLQYVDLRMRKEAFDVELMSRAGIAPQGTTAP